MTTFFQKTIEASNMVFKDEQRYSKIVAIKSVFNGTAARLVEKVAIDRSSARLKDHEAGPKTGYCSVIQ